MNALIQFLKQGWLPNLLGLVGGLVGLWTFIDSYLIKFRPKIFFGTKVIIETATVHDSQQLSSIFCSLELCNHRKKYGVIYDFAIRIYKADEINSDRAIYYASEVIETIPVNIGDIDKQKLHAYSPITVLPNSNKSINLVLSEVLYRSKMQISPFCSYFIEIYYQKKPKGKWYFIDKLYLYNKGQLETGNERYIQFTVLNYDTTREKLNRNVRTQKTNLYEGASQKFLSKRYEQYLYKFIKKPYYRIIDLFISIPFYAKFIVNNLIDKLIKIPIINRYGKTIEKTNIRFGSPELKPITIESFENIYLLLQKHSKQINLGAKKEAEIIVKKQDGQIIISRYKLALKFYISGDSYIQVQDAYSAKASRLSYRIQLKNKIWNKKFWYLDNYGFITIKSFVVRVLDAFVIHSNY